MGPNARKWDFTRNTLSAVVNTCLIRLAVRTPRCGRGNPGSNPGLDIVLISAALNLEHLECSRVQAEARLAQSVERQPFKLVVVGSSPTVGAFYSQHFTYPSYCVPHSIC